MQAHIAFSERSTQSCVWVTIVPCCHSMSASWHQRNWPIAVGRDARISETERCSYKHLICGKWMLKDFTDINSVPFSNNRRARFIFPILLWPLERSLGKSYKTSWKVWNESLSLPSNFPVQTKSSLIPRANPTIY